MEKKSAEAYLDRLLNSVSEKKEEGLSEVKEALARLAEEAVEEDTAEKEFFKALMEEANDIELEVREGQQKKRSSSSSHRVTKSEADFLQEFEEELEGDKYKDYLTRYENQYLRQVDDSDIDIEEEPEEPVSEQKQEAVDLDKLIGGASEIMGASEKEKPEVFADEVKQEPPVFEPQPEEPSAFEPQPEEPSAMEAFQAGFGDASSGLDLSAEDVEQPLSMGDAFGSTDNDAFADFFGAENMFSAPVDDPGAASSVSSSGDPEVIDLSNLGEQDLMNLLAGSEGFADISDMLAQSESGVVPIEDFDSFAAFAEGEMSAQAAAGSGAEQAANAKKEKKKGGFWEKLSKLLFGEDDDETENEVSLNVMNSPSAAQLSSENANILANLEAEEKGGKDDKKKKKEKKKKEKKEKTPKKEKKVKPPKEKKEKKPKEVDNTPPLPKGPVRLIWAAVISLFALVLLGTSLVSYSSAISTAKDFRMNGEYADAFRELDGIKIKEKDLELYNQIAVLAPADSELKAFEVFYKHNMHIQALDSLICAAGRCELNAEQAALYACEGALEKLQAEASDKLRDVYGMTYEEALELYHSKNRDIYTVALNEKIKELGLE